MHIVKCPGNESCVLKEPQYTVFKEVRVLSFLALDRWNLACMFIFTKLFPHKYTCNLFSL